MLNLICKDYVKKIDLQGYEADSNGFYDSIIYNHLCADRDTECDDISYDGELSGDITWFLKTKEDVDFWHDNITALVQVQKELEFIAEEYDTDINEIVDYKTWELLKSDLEGGLFEIKSKIEDFKEQQKITK